MRFRIALTLEHPWEVDPSNFTDLKDPEEIASAIAKELSRSIAAEDYDYNSIVENLIYNGRPCSISVEPDPLERCQPYPHFDVR